MQSRRLGDLAKLLHGELIGADADLLATGFATDNRQVQPGDVFLCIRGAKVDGHDFSDQALAAGAVACVAERTISGSHIRVPNLVDALARMASTVRSEFDGPVVGITGSAGKTTTKEFLAAALRPLGSVLKTQGNRNTEYTAPLLWMELDGSEAVVVVEMSMRGFGQIEHLARFSRPTVGIITNIGVAHVEHVGDRHGIARAKAELLQALPIDGLAVLPRDDDFFEFLVAQAPCPVATFGWDSSSDARATSWEAISWSESILRGTLDGEPFEARVPVAGRHLAPNILAALLAAKRLGVSVNEAAAQLPSATLPSMRMEVLQIGKGTVILDAYNASPPAMIAALETLAELPARRRLAILGEMKELGPMTESMHAEVGRTLARLNLDQVILLGDAMKWAFEAAKPAPRTSIERAENLSEASRLVEGLEESDVLLIKGSRSLELERLVTPVGA